MHGLVAAVGLELTKRAAGADGDVAANVSGFWVFLIALLNIAVFLPLSVFVLYTFGGVLPTLAMIEDPHASSRYVELSPSLDDDEDDEDAEFEGAQQPRRNKPRANLQAPVAEEGVIFTSSVRATLRQLYRLGGWRALFRGLFCAWVVSVATATVGAIVSTVPFVPFLVGTLVANLALVQLHTAWVHIVISTKPVSLAFWRRMPAFRRTFDATKYVVLVQWFATTLTQYLPFGVAWLVGVPQAALNLYNPNPADDDSAPAGGSQQPIAAWKHVAILAAVILCLLFIHIPAAVALVRVQASILPPEEDTVVPFDRSFGGTVEPAVINGNASVSIPNALRTFSRDSWVRLYKLMAKVIALTFVLFLLIAAVIVPQTVLISRSG
ncbi:hypothetical protein RB595_001610 [Gaeumannomyces hyphopodioides]